MLADGSVGQHIDYAAHTHTIRVPITTDPTVGPAAPHPLDQVRADILWEMHNAANKGPLGRAGARLNSPLRPGTTADQTKEQLYKQANLALSYEWIEWAKTLEHVLRVRKISGELPAGPPPQVQDQFGAHYAVADAGWYRFRNYLDDMIARGHTTGYDPNATAAKTWKGWRILQLAQSKSKAPLEITAKQQAAFETGKKREIKDEGVNPFRADALWQEAMDIDR